MDNIYSAFHKVNEQGEVETTYLTEEQYGEFIKSEYERMNGKAPDLADQLEEWVRRVAEVEASTALSDAEGYKDCLENVDEVVDSIMFSFAFEEAVEDAITNIVRKRIEDLDFSDMELEREMVCAGCGCDFLLYGLDVKITWSTSVEDDGSFEELPNKWDDYYAEFTCPGCGNEIDPDDYDMTH